MSNLVYFHDDNEMEDGGFTLEKVWNPLDFTEPEYDFDEDEDPRSVFTDIFEGAVQRCNKYKVPVTPLSDRMEGRETGDDRVDLSDSSSTLAIGLEVQTTIFGMRTSEKDTFISEKYWNYCEVSSTLPKGRNESYHYARRNSNFSKMGYSDTAPMRITIDAQKGDRGHSSTVVGKSSMMGLRVATPNTRLKHRINMCSYLQDGMLRTYKSPEPKYLPRCLGGSGCPALFGHWENLYLSIHAYRGGGYDRLYGTAANQAREALNQLELGRVPDLTLLNRLREKEDYFHATYGSKVIVPKPGALFQAMGKLPKPMIEAGKETIGLTSFENRLVQSRHLIGERQAISELNAKHKLENEIFGNEKVTKIQAREKYGDTLKRKEYDNALTANTAFNNLLERTATPKDVTDLVKQGFLATGSGLTSFRKHEAKWLFDGGKSKTYNIEDLCRTENLYATEDVSVEDSMRVSGIPIRPYICSNPATIQTVSRVGLYNINQTKQEWCDEIYTDLRRVYEEKGNLPISYNEQLDVYGNRREWINDDNPLLELVKRDVSACQRTGANILFITGDLKMSRQTASIIGLPVYTLDPEDLIKVLALPSFDPEFKIEMDQLKRDVLFKSYDPLFFYGPYIDYGALETAAAAYEYVHDNDGKGQTVKRMTPISNTFNDEGNREFRYSLCNKPRPRRVGMKEHKPKFTTSKRTTEFTVQASHDWKRNQAL